MPPDPRQDLKSRSVSSGPCARLTARPAPRRPAIAQLRGDDQLLIRYNDSHSLARSLEILTSASSAGDLAHSLRSSIDSRKDASFQGGKGVLGDGGHSLFHPDNNSLSTASAHPPAPTHVAPSIPRPTALPALPANPPRASRLHGNAMTFQRPTPFHNSTYTPADDHSATPLFSNLIPTSPPSMPPATPPTNSPSSLNDPPLTTSATP